MKRIVFTIPARADVGRIDRESAVRILIALHHFAETGQGDIKKLQGDSNKLRLRVGDYRVRFILDGSTVIVINPVLHRSEAYR